MDRKFRISSVFIAVPMVFAVATDVLADRSTNPADRKDCRCVGRRRKKRTAGLQFTPRVFSVTSNAPTVSISGSTAVNRLEQEQSGLRRCTPSFPP